MICEKCDKKISGLQQIKLMKKQKQQSYGLHEITDAILELDKRLKKQEQLMSVR